MIVDLDIEVAKIIQAQESHTGSFRNIKDPCLHIMGHPALQINGRAFFPMFLALMVVSYVPEFSEFLPRFFGLID